MGRHATETPTLGRIVYNPPISPSVRRKIKKTKENKTAFWEEFPFTREESLIVTKSFWS